MNKKLVSAISLSFLLLLPIVVFAAPFDAGTRPGTNLNAGTQWLNDLITALISSIWMLFVAFAIIMFIWAGILFLSAQGEIEVLKQAKKALLWGIIGVVVGILAFSLPWIIYGGLFGSQSGNNGGGGGGDNIVLGACTVNGVCSQATQADCQDPMFGTWRPGPCCSRRPGETCTRPGSNECCQSTCIADSGSFNRNHCVGVMQ